MKKFLLTGALIASLHASAAFAAGVALLSPVTIDPEAHVPDAVRQECRLDYQLESDILAAMRRYDPDVATTTDASTGKVLKVTISYVLGVGGGAWTGPKALAVHIDMLQDGKVAYTAKMHRRSSLGGMFRGTCTLLDGASKGLGKTIAKWAQRPRTNNKDVEEPEAEAPAASEPANPASEPASAVHQ